MSTESHVQKTSINMSEVVFCPYMDVCALWAKDIPVEGSTGYMYIQLTTYNGSLVPRIAPAEAASAWCSE